MTKKVINSTEQLKEVLNIELTERDKQLLDYFFKRKGLQLENKKITYPTLSSAREKNQELEDQIKNIKEKIIYWKKQKEIAENYHKKIPRNMLLKKNYWKHKLKKLTDKDYKKDIEESKLEEKVLMDPEYQNVLETFLVDPDYRSKLKETINNSIVYREVNLGSYSIRKQDFKKKNAEHIVLQLNKKLKEAVFKQSVAKRILLLIKKHS